MLKTMNNLTGIGASAQAQAPSEDLALLKKSQDLAKDNAAQLLETLPPPRPANPPGVGGNLDLTA
jgi:hypothetical protein